MLQLLSDTPLFHGLAIAAIEDEPDTDLTEFLKQRVSDLRVGDPHAQAPMLAITASKKVEAPEGEIPTTTLPVLKPRLRTGDQTVVDWGPTQ